MCLVCIIQETESVEYNSFGIPQVIVLEFMIKHEQNTGTLSQNLRHSIYFRQWNQMEQWHCFNVRKIIGISSMGLTSEMETVKFTVLLKTVCLISLSFILIKKNVGHILQREWTPGYGQLLKITKVCFVGQISSHTPAFLKFSNKLILLEFQMMVVVEVIS